MHLNMYCSRQTCSFWGRCQYWFQEIKIKTFWVMIQSQVTSLFWKREEQRGKIFVFACKEWKSKVVRKINKCSTQVQTPENSTQVEYLYLVTSHLWYCSALIHSFIYIDTRRCCSHVILLHAVKYCYYNSYDSLDHPYVYLYWNTFTVI